MRVGRGAGERGGERHRQSKTVSADGCRSLSEHQWKSSEAEGRKEQGGYVPSDKG